MLSRPSSASLCRLSRYFEDTAFLVVIRVLHDHGTMSDSDRERNPTGADRTISRPLPTRRSTTPSP